MTIALYPHKSGLGLIEPVAQMNQNIAIYYSEKWMYKKVAYLEPITPFQFLNIGAIPLQVVSNKTQSPNLEFQGGELGQIRWYPLDNVQVRVYLPMANGRSVLKNLMSIVDMMTIVRDPCLHLTELFIWEDNDPAFEAINLMDYALTQCRLVGFGYRFITEDLPRSKIDLIKAGREPCVYVAAQGRAGGGD